MSLDPDESAGANAEVLVGALEQHAFYSPAGYAPYDVLNQDPETFETDRPQRARALLADTTIAYQVLPLMGQLSQNHTGSGFRVWHGFRDGPT